MKLLSHEVWKKMQKSKFWIKKSSAHDNPSDTIWSTDERTDGQWDRQTDRQTDGRTKWNQFTPSTSLVVYKTVKIWQLAIGMGWVGLWGFLWWAPSAKRKDHHGVSSGWSSVWHRSNTGLSSTQYEQIPIKLGFWPFWLTPFFFRLITFWWAYG